MTFILFGIVLVALVGINKTTRPYREWHQQSYTQQVQALKVTREELQAMKAEGQ